MVSAFIAAKAVNELTLQLDQSDRADQGLFRPFARRLATVTIGR